MSNNAWKYGLGGLGLLGGVALMVQSGLIGDNTANEVAPEKPSFSAEEKQDLYEAVVMSASARMRSLFNLGVVPETESEALFTALQGMYANPRQDLVEQLAVLNDRYIGASISTWDVSRYSGEPEVIEALSSTFTQITAPIISRDSCIAGVNNAGTFEGHMDAQSQTRPAGVYSMSCRDGATVRTLTYPNDAAGVAVTYNFDLNVAYFDKDDYYARRDCDGNENDCFAVLPFADLDGTAGLTQAFADRTQAEGAMSSIQSMALAQYQENAASIRAELATATIPRSLAP